MSLFRKLSSVGLIAITATTLISWSYIFNVRPVGRLQGPVSFKFYDESNRQIITRITSFTVSERTAGHEWKAVWSLAGRARLSEIIYGGKHTGLKETSPARRLVSGKVYGAFASDGSGGSAGRYFSFKQNGAIVLPDSPD